MGKGGALIATNPTFKGGMEAPDTCVLDLKWERVGYNELKVGRDRVGCFLIEIVAVAVVWWWRQWHTGEDTPSSSNSSSSLAAQAIKASAARRDPSLSFTFPKSEHDQHHRSKVIN